MIFRGISSNFKPLLKNVACLTTRKLQSERKIWGYVAIAFNEVDKDRLQKVGPDRLCAEWLLKNGGAVRFKELPSRLIKDYNVLPPESQKVHIQVADASNSSIMKIGLEHFKNCNFVDTVIFHSCKHLEEDGLVGLMHLNKTLRNLQISSCYNLNDSSFAVISELTNLNSLTLFDLKSVKDIDALAKKLREKLPSCDIKVEK